MKRLIIIVSCFFALASSLDKKKKRRDVFDSYEIDENALARSYEEGDDIDVRELPSTDERKKFEGIDWGEFLFLKAIKILKFYRKSKVQRSHDHAQ